MFRYSIEWHNDNPSTIWNKLARPFRKIRYSFLDTFNPLCYNATSAPKAADKSFPPASHSPKVALSPLPRSRQEKLSTADPSLTRKHLRHTLARGIIMAGPLTRLRDKELAAAKERHAQLAKIFLDPTTPETLRVHCSRQAEVIRARFVTEFPHTLEQLAEERKANMDKKEISYESGTLFMDDRGIAIVNAGWMTECERNTIGEALVIRYNAHDELVAALKAIAETRVSGASGPVALGMRDSARAALAKAGAL